MTYAGVFEAVKIRKSGYPFRLSHARFRARYRPLVDAARLPGDARKDCEHILKVVNQDFGAVKLGQTMVLYRAPEHRVLELLRNLALETLVPKAQRGARRGVGRRYREVLAKVSKDLDAVRASPRFDDAAAVDAACDAALEVLGPHQAIFPHLPHIYTILKERRHALQERLDLDPVFRALAASTDPTYEAVCDAVRRADVIKDIPGTPAQMALEHQVRDLLVDIARSKIDPVASEALAALDEDLMRTIADEGKRACYESDDLKEIVPRARADFFFFSASLRRSAAFPGRGGVGPGRIPMADAADLSASSGLGPKS